MNKILLFVFIVVFAGIAYSVQTITDLNTNTPVPLGQLLTVTGTFEDTDSNSSIFCKFLTKKDDLVIERFTDERTFANGDFYTQRTIEEPLYERDSFYVVSVTCESATQDTNFTVAQRDAFDRVASQEFKFAFDQGNTDVLFILGFVVLIILLIAGLFFGLIKGAL